MVERLGKDYLFVSKDNFTVEKMVAKTLKDLMFERTETDEYTKKFRNNDKIPMFVMGDKDKIVNNVFIRDEMSTFTRFISKKEVIDWDVDNVDSAENNEGNKGLNKITSKASKSIKRMKTKAEDFDVMFFGDIADLIYVRNNYRDVLTEPEFKEVDVLVVTKSLSFAKKINKELLESFDKILCPTNTSGEIIELDYRDLSEFKTRRKDLMKGKASDENTDTIKDKIEKIEVK